VQTHDLTVAVTDDDEVFRVVLPAGTLMQDGDLDTRFVAPASDHLESFVVEQLPNGDVRLSLATRPIDLSAADRVDHMVEVAVTIGTQRATHTRLWQFANGHLAVADLPDA
jgi:hypothetical protein